MSSTNNDYNGWSNYETWLCNVWFSEFFQEYLLDRDDDLNVADLADHLKSITEEMQPEVGNSGFFVDLLKAAFSEVDFYEIAENLLAD